MEMEMEIEIERCDMSDLDYVNGIMRHPSVYAHISDDHSPEAASFSAAPLLMSERAIFLRPVIDGFGAGLFLFHPWNSVCFEAHTCVLPGFRGRAAVLASGMAAAWMFENTGCRKIVTHVPAWNRAAYALARRAGFRAEGVNRKSFLRNGRLCDQAIMGLSKEDWEQRACAKAREAAEEKAESAFAPVRL